MEVYQKRNQNKLYNKYFKWYHNTSYEQVYSTCVIEVPIKCCPILYMYVQGAKHNNSNPQL